MMRWFCDRLSSISGSCGSCWLYCSTIFTCVWVLLRIASICVSISILIYICSWILRSGLCWWLRWPWLCWLSWLNWWSIICYGWNDNSCRRIFIRHSRCNIRVTIVIFILFWFFICWCIWLTAILAKASPETIPWINKSLMTLLRIMNS